MESRLKQQGQAVSPSGTTLRGRTLFITGATRGIGLAIAGSFTFALWLALRARRRPVHGGAEEMPGREAVVARVVGDRAQVRIRGELWQAASSQPLLAGQRVRVVSRDGLLLQVEPLPGHRPPETINQSPETTP